jgi:hypothetical protein
VSVSLEGGGQLKGVGRSAFSDAPLPEMALPRGIQFVCGWPFFRVSDDSVSVSLDNDFTITVTSLRVDRAALTRVESPPPFKSPFKGRWTPVIIEVSVFSYLSQSDSLI